MIHQMIHRQHQIQNEEEGGLKRKASEKDVVSKNMSQIHLRAMTLMTRIHPTTVILDVDDTHIHNIGKRTQLDYAQI